VERALRTLPEVRSVRSSWQDGNALLLGRDARSALLLVETTAASITEAENLTPALRGGAARADQPAGYRAIVTGTPAVFHDLNANASDDLRNAELVGLPLTLLILLAVFRSPLAAALPLGIAGAAAALAFAALYLLREAFPVSVFAQNAVTMIGLGAGVDYALFIVHRFRRELARGLPAAQAAIESSAAIGPAVLTSGIAVGIGFLALLLVNASFLRSLAVGGLLVIGCAVALSLTLLPLALARLGPRVNWPLGPDAAQRLGGRSALWQRWSARVMAHPWICLLAALAAITALALPALRTSAWNVGAAHLPAHMESRQGQEALARNFSAGWTGPVLLAVEAAPGHSLLEAPAQQAMLAIAGRLARDPRVAAAAVGRTTRATGELLVVPRAAPEAPEALALVRALRGERWPEAAGAGLSLAVGGASAAMADFDAEMLGSLWRVVPAVLAVTFVVLVACFRSLLVPLKAVCANLVSVLAAFGFLVLVFQDGVGAAALGIEPPGGLNSFIVLMLFTILFGLSMDYEVLLLRSIQEARVSARGNAAAVAAGLERSAGVITSAAAVMICLFGSFALTELTATREFGLGLAVAVAVDATLIRLLVIPAAMKLLGEVNWWFPGVPA
jgi:RND superfamily putative drug exporter